MVKMPYIVRTESGQFVERFADVKAAQYLVDTRKDINESRKERGVEPIGSNYMLSVE